MMLPRIFADSRRKPFIRLALNGVTQGGLALVSAGLLGGILTTDIDSGAIFAAGLLLAAAVCMVQLKYHEYGEAERIGQDYVIDVRLALFAASTSGSTQTTQRHGIAMTRLTSDLTSVKNWVSLGIARIIVSSITIAGGCGALWLWSPVLALYGMMILGSVLLLGALIAIPLRTRLRTGRRYRGRLAARVGELLLQRETVAHFDGVKREARRVRRISRRMASALSERMSLVGAMQGLADLLLPASAVAFLLIVINEPALAAQKPLGALVIVGFLSSPVRHLLRAIDYWLAFKEACRRLEPVLAPNRRKKDGGRAVIVNLVRKFRRRNAPPPVSAPAPALPALEISSRPPPHDAVRGRTLRLALEAGRLARPEELLRDDKYPSQAEPLPVRLTAGEIGILQMEPSSARRVFRWLAGFDDEREAFGAVFIDDKAINHKSRSVRRRTFKLVSPELPLLRRSGERNLTDFAPKATPEDVQQVLAACALGQDAEYAAIKRRRLDEQGRSLSPGLSARLRLARAVLARPQVLLIDDPAFIDDARAQAALSACVDARAICAIVATMPAVAAPIAWRSIWIDAPTRERFCA